MNNRIIVKAIDFKSVSIFPEVFKLSWMHLNIFVTFKILKQTSLTIQLIIHFQEKDSILYPPFFFFLAKKEITYLVSVHWRRNISLQNYSGKLSLKLSNEYFPVKIPVKNDTQGWGNCTQCRSFEFILVSSKRWPFFDTARISCLSKICTGNDKSISIHMPICSLSTLNLSQSIQD